MINLPPGWTLAYPDDIKADSPNSLAIGPFGSNLKVSDYRDVGVPLVFVRNIRAQAFASSDLQFVSRAKAESLRSHIVRQGDLLVTKMGDPPGDVAIYPLSEEGIVTADCIKLTPNPSIDARYLLYALRTPGARRQIIQITQGVAQPKVSLARFRRGVQIPLAPAAEQKRIVAAIEEQFSRLDAGVAALERARKNLKRLRFAALLAAVQGALVPQSVNDEPAAEAIARVSAGTRFRGTLEPLDANMRPLPDGWAWARVGKLAARVTVGHVGPTKGKYVPDGVPFLRSQNVRVDYFDPSGLVRISPDFHHALVKSAISPGDVVIVRSGVNRGMACVVPEFIGEANCADLVVVQRPSGVHPRFLSFFINSLAQPYIQSEQVGVAIPHFNTQSLSALPVPVPPLSEQIRIVEAADQILFNIERLTEGIDRQIARSITLRSGILDAAFSGRLMP